jgi:hypothetical protein
MTKSKKSGVPKKVAGVKVPKSVRQSKSIGTLLTSDLGREILADALIAAAGAAAAALTRTRAARTAGNAVAEAGAGTGDLVQTAAGAVATVVTEAAKNILPAALVGGGQSEGEAKPRYLHKTSDLDSRKRSKKDEKKSDKGEGKKRSRAKKAD